MVRWCGDCIGRERDAGTSLAWTIVRVLLTAIINLVPTSVIIWYRQTQSAAYRGHSTGNDLIYAIAQSSTSFWLVGGFIAVVRIGFRLKTHMGNRFASFLVAMNLLTALLLLFAIVFAAITVAALNQCGDGQHNCLGINNLATADNRARSLEWGNFALVFLVLVWFSFWFGWTWARYKLQHVLARFLGEKA